MSKENKFGAILRFISDFLTFFLSTSVVTTCSVIIFLNCFADSAGAELTEAAVTPAAKWTMLAVILLSLLFTALDALRKKLTVQDPVRMITDAADRIMKGDFSVRINIRRGGLVPEEYCEIADRINKMTEELRATETLRTDFVANVSHELRTPLSVIHNYAELLSDKDITEAERDEYLASIRATSRRLSQLVGNILRLNKLENRQIAPVYRRFDLAARVGECLLGFEDALDKKRLSLNIDLDDSVMIYSDPEMLDIVWNNLISNAVKFSSEGGSITVSCKDGGDCATVTVADSGCGITPEVGKHMFDKFYQGDTSHASEGNGLGLAMVQRVIDITSSSISVNSTPGVGSTFTVRIKKEKNG